MTLQGRCAVLTGAAGGLGAAAAARLAAAGARVVISDIDGERAATRAREIDPRGDRVMGMACDIARDEDSEALVREAERFFGRPLDIFVANAGVGFAGSLLDATPQQIRHTFDVNVTGTLLSARAALRSLVKSPVSSLIFTCSLQGVTGRGRRSAYVTSKHAIVGMVKALALEFGPSGVRVNAIAPAATDTAFMRDQLAVVNDDVQAAVDAVARSFPLGHLPGTEDFAEAVLFLSASTGKSITGHTLVVDCGASAGKM